MKPITLAKMLQVEVNRLVASVDKDDATHLIAGHLLAINALTQAALLSNAIPDPLGILRSMHRAAVDGHDDKPVLPKGNSRKS